MGLRFVSAEPGEVVAELEVGPIHLQPYGLVHGGVHAGLIETVCSVGAHLNVADGKGVVGVENHTSFIRAATSGTLVARATPVHVGRRAQLWQAEVRDGNDRLLARGTLRTMVISLGGGEPGGGTRPKDSDPS